MWTVKSEWGRLHAVLIQDSVEQFWSQKLPFPGIESSTHYISRDPHAQMDEGYEQWLQLPKILRSQGVKIFEVKSILENIFESASIKERKEIVDTIWKEMSKKPDPRELTVDNLFWGYPSKPYYDINRKKVIIPDHRRVAWTYTRDTSFTTPVGTVISNMRRYSRKYEPKIIKLCYQYDPILSENIKVVYDASEHEEVYTEPLCIEGGDTQIIDEETIAIGVGQRSTVTGFKETAKQLFELDLDGTLKYVCSVNLADYPAVDYMHLDVTINWLDNETALIMPYVYDTELIKNYPSKMLLLKYLEAIRMQSEAHGRPISPLVHPKHFRSLGRTSVYEYYNGKLVHRKNESSFLDFLIKEGKLEKDKIIYVGGLPEEEYNVEHMLDAMMEQSRGAPNIVALKPGVVIAYKRNKKTNQELRNNNVKVIEWEDSYLDLLGGPHCSTCPLWRD